MLNEAPYPPTERREILPLLPKDIDSLLDIGCARGGFGKAVRETLPTARLVAIEASAAAAEEARAWYDEVLVGHFPECAPEERFDCLVLLDVLEHMLDPWAALAESRRLLRPGGIAILSIPNVRYFSVVYGLVVRGDWTYTDHGSLDRTHLRFFTRTTIIEMLEFAGYDIDSIKGISSMADRGRLKFLSHFIGDLQYLQFAVAARPRAR